MFHKNLETHGKIFKFLITYAHLKQQSLLENFGSEIPLPVRSPKNGFSLLTLRTNVDFQNPNGK